MTDDPLYRPLRVDPPPKRRGRRAALVSAGCLAVLGAAALGAVVLRGSAGVDRDTAAVAPIEPLKPALPGAPSSATRDPPPATASTLPDGSTVEIQNGVKVIRMGAGGTRAPLPGSDGAAAVHLRAAPDPRLIERTAAGDLPRVGADGLRPAEAYARPVEGGPAAGAGTPRLALLVGDLGPDANLAAAATTRLPGPVSLAFRPDGPDPAGAVARAREAGHEVLLEFPGAAGARPAGTDALATLHAAMARFAGYVGVTAEIGGALPAGSGGGAAVFRDLASRGLILVDNTAADPGVGPAAPPPLAASPDVIIDGRLPPSAVAAALAQLEQIALARGQALGYAGHLPNLDAVAAALAGASGRGVMLVPVSALARGPTRPQAEGTR